MDRIAVIGGGTMGAGIAEVCARAGSSVGVLPADPRGAPGGGAAAGVGPGPGSPVAATGPAPGGPRRCRARIDASLQRAVRADRLSAEEADSALARIDVATELEGAADADLVVEAVPE